MGDNLVPGNEGRILIRATSLQEPRVTYLLHTDKGALGYGEVHVSYTYSWPMIIADQESY